MDLQTEHRKTLLDNLYKFQQDGTFTDVTIVVKQQEIKAHRNILASSSHYFMAMFNNNMLEANASVVEISGVELAGFDLLLKYMYTSELDIDDDNFMEILSTAVYLQVDEVSKMCVEYLKQNMNMDNCLNIIIIADTYNLMDLRTYTYNFVSQQMMTKREMIVHFTADLLEYAISRDFPLDCTEADVLLHTLRWFLYGSKKKIRTKEQLATRILQHIRFREISPEDLKLIISELFIHSEDSTLLNTVTKLYSDCRQNVTTVPSRGMKPAILRVGGFSRKGLTNEISYSFVDERHWSSLTNIPLVRQCNYGVAVLNNMLYIVGGCFDQHLVEIVHANGFKFNPCTNEWDKILPMSTDRCRFTLNALNDKLYAVGGTTSQGYGTNTVECYNRETNTWTFIESLPEPRHQHAAVALEYKGSNLLFVSGGLHKENVIASMFMYDESKKTWTLCAPLLAPRTDHVMFTYNDKIYVCGGWYTVRDVSIFRNNARTKVATIDAYDIQTNTWTHVTTVPATRYHVGAVVHDSKIYLIGGFHRSNDFEKHTVAVCYDIATDTWTNDVKDQQDFWEHTNVMLNVPKYL